MSLTFQEAVVKQIIPYLDLDQVVETDEEQIKILTYIRLHRALNYLACESGIEETVNNGVKIDEEILKQIFITFNQVKSSDFYFEVRQWYDLFGHAREEALRTRKEEFELLNNRVLRFLVFIEGHNPGFLQDFAYESKDSKVDLVLTSDKQEAYFLPVQTVEQAKKKVDPSWSEKMKAHLHKLGYAEVTQVKCLVESRNSR